MSSLELPKTPKASTSPEIINSEIIKRIRKIRRDKEISQEQLAHLAGVHRNYIGMLERGENSPSVLTLVKITTALKVKLSSLFKGF